MDRRRAATAALSSHAHALFTAISVAIAHFGCGDGAVTSPSVGPPPSTASNSAETGGAATPAAPSVDAPLDTASASAWGSASATGATAASASASASAPTSASASASVARQSKNRPRPKRGITVEGRPFLVHDCPRVAPLEVGPGWQDALDLEGALPDAAQSAALIEHYTHWALCEHASIAAFARFTLQLLALGAPADLVARASAAIADETRHASLGFGLVAQLGGAPVRPGALPIDGALERETTLEHVLRLTVREGILGETLAALEAMVSADTTEISSLAPRLRELADDEARHAELAFSFAAWALTQDPDLGHVIEDEVAAWSEPPLPVASGLERWGVLDTATRRTIRSAGFATVICPLVDQLRQLAAPAPARATAPAPASHLS